MKKTIALLLGLVALLSGCGKRAETSQFDGDYVLDMEATQQARPGAESENDAKLAALLQQMYSPLSIRGGVIRYGRTIIGEFRLLESTIEGNELKGEAIWHEDVHDPGDMTRIKVMLRIKGERLEFTYYEDQDPEGERDHLIYRRQRS